MTTGRINQVTAMRPSTPYNGGSSDAVERQTAALDAARLRSRQVDDELLRNT